MSCRTLMVCCLLGSAFASPLHADDWPQWRGPQRDGVWRENRIVSRLPAGRITPKWSVPIGAGYTGPTVADGRVFAMDRQTMPREVERVLCFDEELGREIWKLEYDCPYTISYEAGPRASVTIADDRAFALGSMGHLHCLDAGTGAVLWKHNLLEEYDVQIPLWGISGSPLVVDKLVIVQIGGRPEACLVAFDQRSGDEVWKAVADRASYASPILIEQAGQKVVVCLTGDSVVGLDPATGTVHWRAPFAPKNMPIGVATPVVAGSRLFVSAFYDGSLMLELLADRLDVREVWRKRGRSEQRTEALHCMISTPLLLGNHVYGVDSYGELRCLDALTGERIWEDQTATPRNRWSNIHMVQHEDRVWMFNEKGELLIARLSPEGFQELSRAQLIDPTQEQHPRGVCWSHPAYANRHIFIRTDKELLCASLADD